MRLLALCADRGVPVDGTKGATVHLLELWRALARRGAHVTGIAPVRGDRMPGLPHGLDAVTVHGSQGGAPAFRSRLRRAALERADHARPDGVLERLALGSRVGLEIGRRTGAPLVVEVNAPLDVESERYRVPASRAEVEAVRDTLHGADRVYCVSRGLIGWARSLGAAEDRIELLANGVDVAAFARAAERAASDSTAPGDAGPRDRVLRIGFVGSFKPWHGLEHLLEAASLARTRGIEFSLGLVGDGPERPRLVERAASLGLADRVEFLGARPHADIPGFLHTLDIAVAPASDGGGGYYYSPLKLFEYAAAGCAIIAPAAGQVPEWFRHGIEAWLVPPADPVAIADAIVRLEHDPHLRRGLGVLARRRAEREFDWAQVADRILGWMRDARGPNALEARWRGAS